MMTKLNSNFHVLALIAILLVALALRLTGVGWDDDSRLHPDERFMTDVVSRIGNPDNLTEEARARCPEQEFVFDYFNTDCSAYNPDNVVTGSYAYGTLPLFIVRWAAHIAAQLNLSGLEEPQMWLTYDYIHLVGRVVNAVADTLVVLLVFLIGKRLFGIKQGLIAAALYAFAVLPIQLAHFWTVDPISNLFLALGLYATIGVVNTGSYPSYALFGIALGCAAASRINLAPMAALLPIAVATRLQSEKRLLKWRTWFVSEGVLVLGGFAIALLVFRIAQPYAFVGPTINNWSLSEGWQRETQEVSDMSRLPTDGWPPSVQWFERIGYLYPWFQMIMWGMSLVVGVTATLALASALVSQLFRRRLSPQLAVISLWIVGYFALTGNLHLMTMRYYLPVYPALLLLAAWFVVAATMLLKSARLRLVIPAVIVVAAAVAGISFTTSIYTQPITRIDASAWMNDNLPTTIDFFDADQNRLPVNVQRDTMHNLLMQTAFNGESYISEPVELMRNQLERVEVLFSDTKATQVQIRLLDGTSEEEVVLAQFDLQTDARGHLEIPADELPPLPSGTYQWHIASSWDETVVTQEGVPTTAYRHFIPSMVLTSEGSTVRQPIEFRSPYQSVPYLYIGTDRTVEVRTEEAITVTELTFAHLLDDDPSTITLLAQDEEYTATPVDSDNDNVGWNTLLGRRQRFELDRPLELSEGQTLSLGSSTEFMFTATAIATEGFWDDSLPVRYCTYNTARPLGIGLHRDCINHDSYARFHFSELLLNMAETDDEIKYRRMVDVLTQADFFVISSNRFYDAQPRVPRRFAMSIEYFDRLFSGSLNYEILQTFRRGSNFLGITFPHEVLPTDDTPGWLNELEAEEAFTVYDHPTVFVFQNNGFERFRFPYPTSVQNSVRPELEVLPAPTYELATAPLTDDDVVFALLFWIIGFLVLGWVSFPLMFALLPSLPLRGFAVGRAVSWLLLSVVSWWLTSGLGRFFWSRPGLWVLILVFLGINAFLAYRNRKALQAYIQENWRTLLCCEVMFLIVLGIGLLLRAVNPDLWEIARGGEKPMDYAYLNAVLRTSVFPAPNPWMAGYPMNYYYFGFVISALPIKFTGIASEVGYNLVLGTLYAVVFCTVFTIGYALLPQARRVLKVSLALAGAVFAMLAGNLGTLQLILTSQPGMEPHRWYWYPTRILGESANYAGGAINEIPLFSFLFGDLHAHILGLLPTMLFFVGMYALYRQKRWWIAVTIGAIAGAIYMTNIWDVLPYAPVGALLLWLATRNVVRFIWWGICVAAGALVTIAPLDLSLGTAGGLELWHDARSLLVPFVLVWGIPIGIAATWMYTRTKDVLPFVPKRGIQISAIIIVVAVLLALPSTTATTALCVLFVGAALLFAWRDAPEVRFIHIAVALVFAMLLALEYFVVRGDVGRMNTVFKISFQLWMWIGLLIPAILFWTLHSRRYIAAGLMAVMLGIGLLYPLYAIPARHEDSQLDVLTLDGNRFLEEFELPQGSVTDDAAIIRYLRGNADGFPIIAEWYDNEYNWNSRFSVQTGLPAMVGWANHMRQQYGAAMVDEVEERIAAMQTLYTTDNIETIREIIGQYRVNYIIVGLLERSYASSGALEQFAALAEAGELEIVFESGDGLVYRVPTT
jgi:YYY domain-containing protein